MEPIYRQTFTISDIHLDCFGRVKPAVLLYFAQEAAGKHAALLGTDWETLNKKNLFWAIIRHRVQITRLPESGETITLETWPMATTRVAYPRATVAYDAQGNELFRTIALWVLMDTDTRALVLPGKSGVLVNGISRGTELEAPGSLSPKTLPNSVCKQVTYAELDRNLHMNNTRYMDWIDSLLPSSFHKDHPIREFTVCYLSEAREGQTLELAWDMTDVHTMHVEAHRERTDGSGKTERTFAASLQF